MSGKRTNELEALALMRGGMTRRDVLRRFGAAGGVLAAGSLLAACGGSSGSTGGGGPSSSSGPVSIDKTVAPNWVFSNWPLYIDVKNKTDHPSLDKFDKQFNTKTTYQEDIEDNESFFGKVQAQLKAGQDIGRDIVTLTDWMAAKWVALDYCEKLDLSLLPNVEKNLVDALKGRSIDPTNDHLVPWQSGFTGLAYNPDLTGFEVTQVSDLWKPELKGKVTVLTEMRDTLGLVMLQMGIDPTKCTAGRRPEGMRLHAALRRQRPDPPLHGQRLRRRPGQGQRVCLHGVVGRHRPAPARQPEAEVRVPAAGLDALD